MPKIEAQWPTAPCGSSSGGAARRVESSLERVEPILTNVCRSIAKSWDAITDLHVEKVSVELGLSFEGEGNIFVSRAKAGANLVVTLTLTRPVGARRD